MCACGVSNIGKTQKNGTNAKTIQKPHPIPSHPGETFRKQDW